MLCPTAPLARAMTKSVLSLGELHQLKQWHCRSCREHVSRRNKLGACTGTMG